MLSAQHWLNYGSVCTGASLCRLISIRSLIAPNRASAAAGRTATFRIRLRNQGDAKDTFRVKSSPNVKGFTVKYYAGKKDVTKQVVRGTYQFQNLAAGGTAASIKVVVKVNSTAKIGAVQKLTITASSGVTAMDVVKAKVKAVR